MKISHLSKSSIKKYVLRIALLIFVLLFALPNGVITGLAQEQEQVQSLALSILRVDSQDFPQLSAYVTVVDQAGLPLMNLEPDDFEMAEDRIPISSRQVESNTRYGVSLVLALDQSMDQEVFAEIQGYVKAFIDTMTPQDQMAITAFADKAGEKSQALTSDKDDLKRFIDGLAATQKETTATYDAVTYAVDLAAQRGQEGRSAVLLITDSGNVGAAAREPSDEMLETLRNKEVPLYVVGFGTKIQPDNLRSLTDETIGESYLVFGPEEMSATLQTLAVQLRQAYRLTWESQIPFDEKSHELVVNLASPSGMSPASTSFIIAPNARPPFSVELRVVPDIFPVGESVLIHAKVEGRQVSRVEFLRDGTLFETVEQEPYQIAVSTKDYPVGSHQITARVYDTLGEQQEDSKALQVQPAPQELWWSWQWFLPLLLGIFLLLFSLPFTLWLLAWQRRNLRQKFALKIANEGNMPSRYKLRAKEKDIRQANTLQFEFFHLNNPLKLFQPVEPTTEPAPVAAASSQNSQVAQATASPRGQREQSISSTIDDVSNRIQGTNQFLSNLAAVLGPFGAPIRGLLSSVTQIIMSTRYVVQTPGRILGRLGLRVPSGLGGSTFGAAAPTRTNPSTSASTAQVQTVEKPSVITPTVAPGTTLWIDLFVTPPWRALMGADYDFTIVAQVIDQRISQVKSITDKLNLSRLPWYRRFLPLILLLFVLLLVAGGYYYLLSWIW